MSLPSRKTYNRIEMSIKTLPCLAFFTSKLRVTTVQIKQNDKFYLDWQWNPQDIELKQKHHRRFITWSFLILAWHGNWTVLHFRTSLHWH